MFGEYWGKMCLEYEADETPTSDAKSDVIYRDNFTFYLT